MFYNLKDQYWQNTVTGTISLLIMYLLPFSVFGFDGVRVQYNYMYNQLINSVTNQSADSQADHFIDIRLMSEHIINNYDWGLHYQLQGLHSEQLSVSETSSVTPQLSDDRSNVLDLSHVLSSEDEQQVLHRLDRFYIGTTAASYSWKLGRYAVTWGNGMVFSVMDVFNPFNPASIDKEYKTGDDMFYLQYLFETGTDLQILLMPRRDPVTDTIETDQSSFAMKYHALINANDIDVVLARHFNETLAGVGFSYDYSGVLWKTDILYSHNDENYFSLLSNISYAWSWLEKPMTGFIEYYYAGFALDYSHHYSQQQLMSQSLLLRKLQRGEVYTVGKQQLALSVDIEWHPLVHIRPTWFVSLEDYSSLFQWLVLYDYKQNITLTAGFNLYSDEQGTEYSVINPNDINNQQLISDSLFIQANVYF